MRSLAIANAILLSAWSGERLEMPIDSTRFHKALDLRRRQSRLREKVEVAVNIDMEKSYR